MFELHPQLAADTIEICQLELCKALLLNDSRFPWVILVPMRENISEIHQLGEPDRAHLWKESNHVASKLTSHYQGDKMNIAALGNLVPQLHIHHIVRFKRDTAWPNPVWGFEQSVVYDDKSLIETRSLLAQLLKVD